MNADMQRGFTLIEMVATLLIMALLATAAMPLAEGVARHTKERELRAALKEIRGALDRYREAVDTGRIARDTSSGYPKTLAVLVEGVKDRNADGKLIFFLRSIPRDPFCAPDKDTEHCWVPRSYASPPTAPELGEDVFDVHSASDEIGSDDRPYRKW